MQTEVKKQVVWGSKPHRWRPEAQIWGVEPHRWGSRRQKWGSRRQI